LQASYSFQVARHGDRHEVPKYPKCRAKVNKEIDSEADFYWTTPCDGGGYNSLIRGSPSAGMAHKAAAQAMVGAARWRGKTPTPVRFAMVMFRTIAPEA